MSFSSPPSVRPGAPTRAKRGVGFYVFCALGAIAVLRLMGMVILSDDAESASDSTSTQSPRSATVPARAPAPAATAAAPAPVAAASNIPVVGPDCGQLQDLNRPGLLPDGVPAAAASRLAEPISRNAPKPPKPVVIDGETLFVEQQIYDLRFSRLDGQNLVPVHTVAAPKRDGKPLIANSFALAAGDGGIGVLVQQARELFFFRIETKRWSAAKAALVASELSESFWCNAQLAWSGERWGVAYLDNHELRWTTLNRQGKPDAQPAAFAATDRFAPQVVWNGQAFGVLSGRNGGVDGSLGVWQFEDAQATYHPIFEDAPSNLPSDQVRYLVAGWMRWDAGQYHVGVMRDRQGHKRESLLVHLQAGSPARLELCGEDG